MLFSYQQSQRKALGIYIIYVISVETCSFKEILRPFVYNLWGRTKKIDFFGGGGGRQARTQELSQVVG